MKKLAIVVSLVLACVLSFIGIKSVSANDAPSYCVVVTSDYGIRDRNYIIGMLAQRVNGYMTNPKDVDEALNLVGGVDSLTAEEAQALGNVVSADYVIILHAYDNVLYDDILHSVDCGIDVVNTATGNENSYMANILVAKRDNPLDDNYEAVKEFITYMDNIVLK